MLFMIPEPEHISSSRVDLSFGLGSAIRFHREQTVPGIGGVWFGRQLSWAVAGIKAAHPAERGILKLTPVKVANAIEALACKTAFESESGKYSYRGSRAFTRDQGKGIWNFESLARATHYVQITYRQGTVRALPEGSGLGFVQGNGIRFNTMALTPAGNNLADSFLNQTGIGKGSSRVSKFIQGWLKNEIAPGNGTSVHKVYEKIGPDSLTDKEKKIISGRLESLIQGGIVKSDPKRRQRLSEAFLKIYSGPAGKISFDALKEYLGANGGKLHVAHMENAIAFEEMLKAAVGLLGACAGKMDNIKECSFQAMAKDPAVKDACDKLRKSAELYRSRAKEKYGPFPDDGLHFADGVLKEDPQSAIYVLIQKDGRILQPLDGKIMKGPLFKTDFLSGQNDDGDSLSNDNGPDHQNDRALWPLERLTQWHGLWQECKI